MINAVKNIDDFFNQNFKVYPTLEQPFINTYLFRNKLYNILFDKYISNNGNWISTFDGVLLHFAAGLGNPDFKYQNMIRFSN
jgi:hypothetical protein